mgnify:FL=1
MASGDSIFTFEPNTNAPPASNYATFDSRNSHPVLDFDGAADEEAVFGGTLVRNYASNGWTVYCWIGFTSAVSGTSRWQLAVERINSLGLDIDSDSFTSFTSALSFAVSAPATGGVFTQGSLALTNSEIDGVVVGEKFRLKLRRDADGTSGVDDITTDAEFLGGEIKET